MRVLIDGRKLADGGIGTYLHTAIDGLLELDSADLSIIVRNEDDVDPAWRGRVGLIRSDIAPYSLRELFQLGRLVDRNRFDIFHEPHFTLPYGVRIPTVVTVHDIIHLSHPQHLFYPPIARALIRSAIRRATRVVSVSRATAQNLIVLEGGGASALKEKLRVVPNGLRVVRGGEGGRAPLDAPYLLSVISMDKPHKGTELLRASILRILSEHPDLSFVVAGFGVGSWAGDLGGDARVYLRPNCSHAELQALYAGAHALVVPSLAEGFCLPVLEAHAVGTPVVCTPVPAIQELLGPADCVAEEFSPAALASAVTAQRKKIVDRALLRQGVERFAPRVVAQQLLDVYREAIAGGGS